MRRLFPYLATLVFVLLLAAVLFLRPTPFLGVTADAMASSLQGKVPAASTVSCDEDGEDAWTCESTGSGGGATSTYDITVNGFGCWTAQPAGEVAQIGTPATLTGCITLLDH
jgi:hypothetical protein